MKDNNKNRKLKFIRNKNNLRLGNTTYKNFVKVSDLFIEVVGIKTVIEDVFNEMENHVYTKFRLKLRNKAYNIGKTFDDETTDLSTIMIFMNNSRIMKELKTSHKF